MDSAAGGELFQLIVDKGSFFEHEAAEIMKYMLRGLAYLHGQNVVHRDLKPENILFKQPYNPEIGTMDYSSLVIADFGTSKLIKSKHKGMTTKIGSPGYAAPEVLQSVEYDEKCDIWSAGIINYILYVLIVGDLLDFTL